MTVSTSFGQIPTVVHRVRADADPDVSTFQTIERMTRIIRKSLSTPILVAAARELAASVPARSSSHQIADAVFRWVKAHVRFVSDEATLVSGLGLAPDNELLIEPDRLLTMPEPAGDCDDFTMLTCALLALYGVPWELVTVAADPMEPGRYSHVYCRAVLEDGRRLALDTSHGEYPGWETAHIYRRQAWTESGLPVPETPMTIRVNKGLHGLGFDWTAFERLTNTGINFARDVITMRPPQGTAITRTQDGYQVYRLSDSGTPLQFMPPVGGTSIGTLLLIGGGLLVGLLAIGAMSKGR